KGLKSAKLGWFDEERSKIASWRQRILVFSSQILVLRVLVIEDMAGGGESSYSASAPLPDWHRHRHIDLGMERRWRNAVLMAQLGKSLSMYVYESQRCDKGNNH